MVSSYITITIARSLGYGYPWNLKRGQNHKNGGIWAHVPENINNSQGEEKINFLLAEMMKNLKMKKNIPSL